MNSDGAANGLTAPSGEAQELVIRSALGAAGLRPTDVDTVEAHGTGTRLGDPIEARALLATYGRDRPQDRPLWLGSLKSNIGHAQAAAGVLGLIKMIMALPMACCRGTLHIEQPTPHVDWSSGTVRLLTRPQRWAVLERPRRAGVSSFGISGTNAHLIAENAAAGPGPIRSTTTARGSGLLWPISARSRVALAAQASRLRAHLLAHSDLEPESVAYSLATTRRHFPYRATITHACSNRETGEDAAQATLLRALQALECDAGDAALTTGVAGSSRIVFVFPLHRRRSAGLSICSTGRSTRRTHYDNRT